MNNEKEKSADDLFKVGFDHHEETFEPKAWENMKALLDQEDDLKPMLMVPETKSNQKRTLLTILIIMSSLSILSISAWMIFNANNHSDGSLHRGSNIVNPNNLIENNISEDRQSNRPADALDLKDEFAVGAENEATISRPSQQTTSGKAKANGSSSSVKGNSQNSGGNTGANNNNNNSGNKSNSNEIANTSGNSKPEMAADKHNSALDPGEPIKSFDSVYSVFKNGKIHKVFIRKTWIQDEYRYVEIDSLRTVQDGFIGIHFTGQQAQNTDSMSAGFNVQFMSGNRLHDPNWGLYGGFDWGMQFYGSSKKSGVVLNNSNLDSGFTRLRNRSMDFFGRAHLEYAKFPIIPYININAGPRIYYTNQQVSSYVPLKNTESSSSNNAHTSVSMMYGVGAGLRIRVSKVVSLDMRYELMSGTKVKQVDLSKSTFNGLSYNLAYTKANPTVQQFKFGVLFDLSSAQYRKELVKPGYYKITQYDSLILDPSDSNKIILPCNCPCDKNSSYQPREDEQGDIYNPDKSNSSPVIKNRGTRINTGGSSGKGSFPGIRPGGSRPIIKPN